MKRLLFGGCAALAAFAVAQAQPAATTFVHASRVAVVQHVALVMKQGVLAKP